MDADHEFDFAQLTTTMNFYQKIKLVNYIRKQIHNNKCIFCDKSFDSPSDLRSHFNEEQHYKLPDVAVFNHPE